MATPKYKKFYQLMTEQNEKLFSDFKVVHDNFIQDEDKWADTFHSKGRDVTDVIRDWERRLCSGMERGNNAIYSQKVAEKFWNEVKKQYSHIEMVGLKVRKR